MRSVRPWLAFAVLGILAGVWAVAELPRADKGHLPAAVPPVPAGAEVITMGTGCFWRGGAIFQQIPGVVSVTAGYMGGRTKNPTYEQVCSGTTGHVEVSRVVFDPRKTSLERILTLFWATHRPTAAGPGSERSVIFYGNAEQQSIAERSKTEAAGKFTEPIVTRIAPAGEFYAAEEYHQDYYGVKKHGTASCGVDFNPNSETERMRGAQRLEP